MLILRYCYIFYTVIFVIVPIFCAVMNLKEDCVSFHTLLVIFRNASFGDKINNVCFCFLEYFLRSHS